MQPRILYPTSLSFRIEGDIKVFPSKQKLKEFISTKPALQEILRGILSEMLQGPQSTRDITTSMKPTDITMTLNPYLSIITLNVSGLNAPTKRHRISEWIKKNKTHLFAVYKRLILHVKHLQIESEWMENYLSCHWKSKESWSSHPYIRQTRL